MTLWDLESRKKVEGFSGFTEFINLTLVCQYLRGYTSGSKKIQTSLVYLMAYSKHNGFCLSGVGAGLASNK
jgi:hypothetical protein